MQTIESPYFDAGIPLVEKAGICSGCGGSLMSKDGGIRYFVGDAGMVCRDCARPISFSFTLDLKEKR